MNDGIIEFHLTAEQTEIVAPLIRQAASQHNNVLLLATAAPTIVAGQSVWRLQVVNIPACKVGKVIKSIRSVEEPVKELAPSE